MTFVTVKFKRKIISNKYCTFSKKCERRPSVKYLIIMNMMVHVIIRSDLKNLLNYLLISVTDSKLAHLKE